MEKSSGMSSSIDETKEQDKKLLQPFSYILQVPGNNVHTKLTRAFNYWLNIPDEKIILIEDIIQKLQNASLLVDDVEDSSILRVGIPVAHSIYGIASTINAANYVMIIALEKCLLLNHPEAISVYTEQLLEIHRGQGMDIYWRDTYSFPTEDKYNKMTMQS